MARQQLVGAAPLPKNAAGEDAGLARTVIQRRLMSPDGNPLAYYVSETRRWVVWDGRRWAPDPDATQFANACRETACELEAEGLRAEAEAKIATDEARRGLLVSVAKARKKAARRLCSASGIGAAEKLARTERPVNISIARESPFDLHDLELNCPNGIVDLRTGLLRPHDPDAKFTTITPTPYVPDAQCPVFDAMLRAIMPDPLTREQLLACMATALMGFSPQHLAVWYGRGADGKGTLQRILQALLGDISRALPEGVLTTGTKDAHPTELVALEGARFAYADESAEGARLDEARVKQLTGGGPVPVRGMRQDYRSARPTWTLCLLTNHLPNVRSYENAIARRVVLFPFQTRFWLPSDADFTTRPEGAPVGDPGRESHVISHELPGVLKALVDAAVKFCNFGFSFKLSPLMKGAAAAHRADNDAIGTFFAEACFLGVPGMTLPVGQVVEKIKEWCADAGMLQPSQNAVNKWLFERGVDRTAARQGTKIIKIYKGIRWKTDDDDPLPVTDVTGDRY